MKLAPPVVALSLVLLPLLPLACAHDTGQVIVWTYEGKEIKEVVRTPTLWENIQAIWYFSR